MPLKLYAIEDWSRKRLVSELGSATFYFDPPWFTLYLSYSFTALIMDYRLATTA